MNFKKSILTLGTTLALTGAFAVNGTIETEAAGWEARTVEEIKEDIKTNDVASTYTIQWGDTLGAITSAFEIPMEKVVQVNDIANVDLIMTGNILHLSADQKTVSVEDTATQEVKSYDVSEEKVKEVEPAESVQAAEKPAEEPVEEAPAEQTYSSPANNSSAEAEAKAWIAFKESTDNYNAVSPTGKYIGKYQLTNTYLNGDHSPENQERVADAYVASRYGSWVEAKEFWVQNGWY
jgi:LysM repeat protein